MPLEQYKQELKRVQREIAEIESIMVDGRNDPESDVIQEQRYRAGSEALMGYDPDQAGQWARMADQLKANRDKAQFDKEKLESSGGKSQAFKIQSAINSASNLQSSYVDAKQFSKSEQLDRLILAFKEEMKSPNPDIQNAYVVANTPDDLKSEVESGGGEPSERERPGKGFEFNPWIDKEISGLWDNTPAQNADGSLKSPSSLVSKLKRGIISAGGDPETYGASILEQVKAFDMELKRADEAGFKVSERERTIGKEQRREGRDIDRDKILQDEKYLQSWEAMQSLDETPEDITTKRKALNVKLRKETGAAIGADEFTDMMSFVLPTQAYKKFREEVTGLGSVLIGMIDNNARISYLKSIAEDYLSQVDSKKLSKYIDDSISTVYYKKKGVGKPGKSGGEVKKKLSDPLGIR